MARAKPAAARAAVRSFTAVIESDEARRMAEDCLRACLEVPRETGRSLPAPGSAAPGARATIRRAPDRHRISRQLPTLKPWLASMVSAFGIRGSNGSALVGHRPHRHHAEGVREWRALRRRASPPPPRRADRCGRGRA
jgi:hypothetical protein